MYNLPVSRILYMHMYMYNVCTISGFTQNVASTWEGGVPPYHMKHKFIYVYMSYTHMYMYMLVLCTQNIPVFL